MQTISFFFAAIEFQGKHLWCFNATQARTPLSLSTERASSERERFLCRCVSCERRSVHLKEADWSKPVVKSSIISSLKDSVWTPPADSLFAPERRQASRGSLIGSPLRERAVTCSKTAPMLRPVIEILPETRHEDALSFCTEKAQKDRPCIDLQSATKKPVEKSNGVPPCDNCAATEVPAPPVVCASLQASSKVTRRIKDGRNQAWNESQTFIWTSMWPECSKTSKQSERCFFPRASLVIIL